MIGQKCSGGFTEHTLNCMVFLIHSFSSNSIYVSADQISKVMRTENIVKNALQHVMLGVPNWKMEAIFSPSPNLHVVIIDLWGVPIWKAKQKRKVSAMESSLSLHFTSLEWRTRRIWITRNKCDLFWGWKISSVIFPWDRFPSSGWYDSEKLFQKKKNFN